MGFDPNFKPPATVQWNATVEHQLGQGFLLRGSYQASQSWHMWDSREINSAVYIPGNDSSGNPLSTSANIQQRRPFDPFFSGFTFNEGQATASFNSAIISVEKRMTGSLSLLGGYRWSRCMDESASGATTSGSQFTNPKDIFFDRGRCNSDVAHQIKMATVYRLPQFLNMGFLGRNILGGWTMTGILVWRDGFPFSVSSGRDTDLDGVGNNRADLVGDPNLPGGRSLNEKLNKWFNTSAFATPAVGTLGTSIRNSVGGPGFFDLDYSMIKSFSIPYGPFRETQKLDFRAEFFNIFNHPNFNAPVSNMTSSTFGQIQSAGDPRILQFALKYIF
jgi:hypothetical protein